MIDFNESFIWIPELQNYNDNVLNEQYSLQYDWHNYIKLFDGKIGKFDISVGDFNASDAEFPLSWSETSRNIFASKFFCMQEDGSRENSLFTTIDRVLNVFYEQWPKYFCDKENANIFFAHIAYMLVEQMFSFNSPVWFNVGNPYSMPTVSACFITGVEDNLESILEEAKTEGLIFKYGSGNGTNLSSLRSSKENISGGGKSSGPLSFAKIWDSVASVTKSGGITRRAAIMRILNIDHGDIEEFIDIKTKEENKAKALIKQGYDSDFTNPDGAYGSVFFQNSNHSVGIYDNFMKAVELNEQWSILETVVKNLRLEYEFIKEINNDNLRYLSHGTFILYKNDWYKVEDPFVFSIAVRHEGIIKVRKVIKWIFARTLFTKLAEHAWETGDPGLFFLDTCNEWNTCKESGTIRSSNPCGEYIWFDNTSCNLASINLLKFISVGTFDNKYAFESNRFAYTARMITVIMDMALDFAHFPTEKIKKETLKYRTLGIGYANLGAVLIKLNIPYGEKAQNIVEAITATLTSNCYFQSKILANIIGPFPMYDKNKDAFQNTMLKHLEHQEKLSYIMSGMVKFGSTYDEKNKRHYDASYRNAQVTVIAPTGTIGLAMGCDTTGIEPLFSLIHYKQLVGGGVIKFVPQIVSDYIKDMYPKDYESILKYIEENNTVIGLDLGEHTERVLATAIGDNCISPNSHIAVMAAAQKYLSGGISKTINMPNTATVQDIENIYKKSYYLGLKCITIYRDGSKSSQPLTVESKESKDKKDEVKTLTNGRSIPVRKRLNDTRDSITHKFSISGHEGYMTIGLYEDGKPGELFITVSKEGSTIRGLLDSWATNVSIMLQSGIPLETIIEKSESTKFEPSGITQNSEIRFATSILDYIAKYLRLTFLEQQKQLTESENKYNSSTYSGDICSSCGSMLIASGSCYVCSGCGITTGCS